MGRWITESGNLERNGPLCAFDRGKYFDKRWKVASNVRDIEQGFISILVYLLPGMDGRTSHRHLLFIHRRPLLFEQKRTH
jgi:hypothetical protein